MSASLAFFPTIGLLSSLPQGQKQPLSEPDFALESNCFQTKAKVNWKVALSELHNLCGAESSSHYDENISQAEVEIQPSVEKTAMSSSGQCLPNLSVHSGALALETTYLGLESATFHYWKVMHYSICIIFWTHACIPVFF